MRPLLCLLALSLLAPAPLPVALAKEGDAPAAQSPLPRRILVFTKTAGFRHDSIPAGIKCMRELAAAAKLEVEATEDSAQFTPSNLARFGVVVFLNTTGDVLPERAQEEAFERWLEGGGSFMGVHAATDTEFKWPWFARMVGGQFAGHPKVQPAEQVVVNRTHPATAHLPERWKRTDEWYNFKNLQSDNQVLLRLDEKTYQGGRNGDDHPSSWIKPVGRGRMFYTAGGHTKESYSEPAFRQHLAGALAWLMRDAPDAVTPSPAAR